MNTIKRCTILLVMSIAAFCKTNAEEPCCYTIDGDDWLAEITSQDCHAVPIDPNNPNVVECVGDCLIYKWLDAQECKTSRSGAKDCQVKTVPQKIRTYSSNFCYGGFDGNGQWVACSSCPLDSGELILEEENGRVKRAELGEACGGNAG